MTQVITEPTHDACLALLRALPAFGAFRRAVYEDAPPESRGWLATIGVVSRHVDGVRPSQVAALLHVDLSVASRALSQLEELGYVRREPDADDGRATRVHLTDAGSSWLAEFGNGYATRMQDYLTGWSDGDLATLTDLLHRFGTTMETAR